MSKKVKRLLALAVLWNLGMTLTSYSTPTWATVEKEKSDVAYRWAQAAFGVAAFADARTTVLGLERGAVETNPVLGAHPSSQRVYAIKVGVAAVALLAAWQLRNRGHRKGAVALLLVGALLQGAAAARNSQICEEGC